MRKTRSARGRNSHRRKITAAKQKPLPLAEQTKRAAENAVAQFRRYPDPPRYQDDNGPTKVQPACYELASLRS